MKRSITAAALVLVSVALALLSGCQTVHTPSRETVPVAMWIEAFENMSNVATLDPATGEVRAVREPSAPRRERVAKVLEEHGIAARTHAAGIEVADADADRARAVLMTDERLRDSGVIVLVGVPAGTARRGADGLLIPFPEPERGEDVP